MRVRNEFSPGPPPDGPLAPDTVFEGRFRVLDLIARGETGDVYLVDSPPQAAAHVLKVMRPSVFGSSALRSRFVRAAKDTARAASPYILHTLDAGVESAADGGPRPWFTTPLLRGQSLAERVAREGAQPLSEVHELLAALTSALAMAHDCGFVHYDLVPQNVHLGPRHPFALALRELTVSQVVVEAYASRGELVGEAAWMAPEQFRLGQRLSPSANLWSLGLLVFYAAVGRPYFLHALEGETSRELLREILHEPLVTAGERAKRLGCDRRLPAWFDDWFAQCVTRDRSARFADARAAWDFVADMSDNRLLGIAEDVDEEERTSAPLRRPSGQVKLKPSVPPGLVAELRRESARPEPAGATRFGVALIAAAALAVGLSLTRLPARTEVRHPVAAAAPPAAAPAAPPATTPESRPEAPSPPAPSAPSAPAPTEAPASDLDRAGPPFNLEATLEAIRAVHYGSCALPTRGKISVSFAPTGQVRKVSILSGRYDAKTETCIVARFGAARTRPFHGDAQAVTAEIEATR